MGVFMLQTFLRNNPSNFSTYKIHKTKVVIDGPNICNDLYSGANLFTQFNGEYLEYEALVEKFLGNLRQCEVEPIFVFDGLHEPTKLDTCMRRLSDNLKCVADFQRSCNFTRGPAESLKRPHVKCLLVYAVFVAVLKRFNMKYVFVDYEADNAVAELAIKLKCPVMSRDSDYFVFTNYWEDCGGYCFIQPIPFGASPKTFANKVCETCAASGNLQQNNGRCCYYLETTCFRPDQGDFIRLAAPLRPVFAVLWGNDYAPSGYFDPYLPSSVTHGVYRDDHHDRLKKMGNLISWLSDFGSSLQEPINYVLSRVPSNKRPEAEDKFFKGLSLYAVDLEGTTARYGKYAGLDVSGASRPKPGSRISSSTYDEQARQVLRGQGTTGNYELTQNWPSALVEYYRTHPTFKLFDGIYSFGYLWGTDVEDVRHSESAYVCARPLRQLIYSVLCQLEGEDKRGLRGLHGDSKNPHVREILRNKHMKLSETAVNLLKVDLDSPQQMLKLHLGLQWGKSGLPNSLHALACAIFIVLNASHGKGKSKEKQPSTSSVTSSPLILAALAVSAAAFVLHQQETQQQEQAETEKEVVSDRIQQQLSLLIADDHSSSVPLNFPLMHTYAQLQATYATFVTLGAVLIASMQSAKEHHEGLGSLDTVSSCFPSGRLVHRLAVQLDHLSEAVREKEVFEVIFPRLLGEKSMRTDSVQPLSQAVLSQVISTYTEVISFLDALLKGQQ